MTLFFVLLAGIGVLPEDDYPREAVPMMQEVDGSDYVMGPGDVMWLMVQGSMPWDTLGGLTPALMEVTPDGYLLVPSVGAWKVSGMTLDEAVELVEEKFQTRFPGIRGIAGLARMRKFRVPVTGHVETPGMVEATGADRLMDILDKADGITSTGSMTGILIVGGNGDTTQVNVADFLLWGDMSANPRLSLRDRVYVPEAESFVWLEGALRFTQPVAQGFDSSSVKVNAWNLSRRGMTEFIPGETAALLVSRLGGTAPWALRDSCYIVRDGAMIPAPLDDPESPELRPGDLLVCPGVPPVVTVAGEVVSPGMYPHTAGMGAMFYVDQAGGFRRAAKRSATKIRLPDGREVDADLVPSVPAGSSVMVPRKFMVGWEDPLLVVTSITSVIIAWMSLK